MTCEQFMKIQCVHFCSVLSPSSGDHVACKAVFAVWPFREGLPAPALYYYYPEVKLWVSESKKLSVNHCLPKKLIYLSHRAVSG